MNDISLEKEKIEAFLNPKSKSNLLMLCLTILVMFKAIGLGWFFGGIVSYLVYKFKKKEIEKAVEKQTPKSYKEFRKKKGVFRQQKTPIDDKLKAAVFKVKQKKIELVEKRRVLMNELDALKILNDQDEQYAQALRSGLTIVNKQIAKVEESYAHLELSVYNKRYQELLKLVETKKVRKNYSTINRDLGRLLTSLQTDVQKYDTLRHPRATEEYNTLIEDISAFRNRIEQIRRKELLNDISMTGVYDEDRKNSTSFEKMKDLFSNLEEDKSIQAAMDELESLEEEMQRLNAESEVLKKYGDTL